MKHVALLGTLTLCLASCGGNDSSGNLSSGGSTSNSPGGSGGVATGGSTSSLAASGGVAPGGQSAGGGVATGGMQSTVAGGTTATTTTGGISATGGAATVGGVTASGGAPNTGGTKSTGGTSATGGATANGGTSSATGGNKAIGGNTSATGGAKATGGTSSATGGNKATGGATNTGGATTTGGTSATGGTAAIAGAPSFHCVNWADPRDNFVNGLLELSGLSSASDTYATVQQKADQILSEFQTKLQANSIRIPINEPTVSSSWWNAYKGAIDTAVGKGMKVIVAYWAYQNGMPNDATAFRNMWQVVVSAYQSNDLVYFDIHNEPYGYSGTAWNTAAAQWLTNFPNVPKGRVIIAGTGYDDNVVPVGSDSRFNGCLLQLHIYGFWHQDWTTQAQWTNSMTSALGSYGARTIVGEWGAPMTDGSDYSNTNTTGDAFRSYVRAVSDILHNGGMGSCYWPGLRNGDGYSMTTLHTGSPLTLTVNSASGLDRLHWAWGI